MAKFSVFTDDVKFVAILLLFAGISGCQLPSTVQPGNTSNNSARVAALPSPTVTNLTSVAPCYNWPPNAPATNVPIPWTGQKNTLVIKGTNFGAPTGKAVATDLNGQPQSAFSFAVTSWTDTEIKLQVGAVITAIPTGIKISLTTADNRFVSTSFTAVPMISGRIYNTPTYYTNQKRIQMNFQPQPYTAATTTSGSLGDAYTPRLGDVWFFPGGQESVITNMSTSSRIISQSKTSKIEDVTYNTTSAELVNGSGVSVGNGITYRVTTTYFTNGSSQVSTKLTTPLASAFVSGLRSSSYARTYYR